MCSVSSLAELQNAIDSSREDVTFRHVVLYEKIVDIISVIYEGFEAHIDQVIDSANITKRHQEIGRCPFDYTETLI